MCDFCDVTALYGRRPRTKSFEQLEIELEALMAQGTTDVVLFADDNLIGNKRVLKQEFLPKLIEWRRRRQCPFYFATQLTINLVDDPEMMQLLLEAGFRHIFVGIETPEEESLGGSRKNQNLKRDLLEDVHTLHRAGFIVAGGFIVGFDTDTDDVFDRQISFIQASGIPLPIINILKAPPGTELFDRMKREGRLIRDFAFTEGETNVSTVMPPDQLFAGFEHLVRNVLLSQGAFERIIGFLSMYRFARTETKVHAPTRWRHIRSALRIAWHVGVRSSQRIYFWKYLGWTLSNRPGMLDLAFIYAAMTYQMECNARHIIGGLDHERNLHKKQRDVVEAVPA